MLEDALSFPQTADDWIQTVVIGGVLGLLGFLILPAVVVQGYLLHVVRAAAAGDSAPSFTDWGELLVDGLRLFVLQFAIGLVVLVPFVVVFGLGGILGAATGSRAFTGVVFLLGLLAVGVLALVVGYFLPAAVANFAVEDSLAAAFDVETVTDGALTSDYAMAWLLAIVVGLVGGLVGSALSVVVVGVFVLFYVQVVTYYLFGRGFAAGLGTGAWEIRAAAGTAATDAGWSGGGGDERRGRSAEDSTVGGTVDEEGEATADGADETVDEEGDEDATAEGDGEGDEDATAEGDGEGDEDATHGDDAENATDGGDDGTTGR